MLKNKQNYLFTLAVLVLLVVTMACGGSATPTLVAQVTSEPAEVEPVTATTEAGEADAPTEEPGAEPTQAPPTTYQVGDIISMGDVIMVVLGWDNFSGDEFSAPDEGNKFVGVDLVIVNQSTSSINISSYLQMQLKDDTAQVYDVDLMASLAIGRRSPDGEIIPGERVRGQVGFQVPENAANFVFVFDADVWGTGKLFIELGAEPNSVEIPASLPSEQALTYYAVGDVIEIGTTTITINEITNPPGDTYLQPEEGNIFVVVDLTIQNLGTEAINVSSLLQMYLKDGTGQGYDLDLMASTASGGTTPDGEIAPGETIRGQAGYQVPADATGLVFVFDASVWSSGKVFIALP